VCLCEGGLNGMAIDEILDEIEHLLLEAGRVPFTNKRVIEEDDMVRLIDELRDELPKEIQEANSLVRDREQIIADAKREANNIVEQAKMYAIKLTDEHEVVKIAQTQAKEIVEKSMQNSKELKENSLEYADEVFKHLASNISSALDVIQKAHANLNQNKK
jgi:vacuolar-type H+-ATPase subunit H